VKKADSEQIDAGTAFLYGDLEELIFMVCPEGLEIGEDECVLLKKSIYGLVQAARQWYKKFVQMLKRIGFESCLADPCLLCKRESNGKMTILVIYVDDCICIGSKETIKRTVNQIMEHVSTRGWEQHVITLAAGLLIWKGMKEFWLPNLSC